MPSKTNPHMFDPLNLRNVETFVYLRKRSNIRLLPQL